MSLISVYIDNGSEPPRVDVRRFDDGRLYISASVGSFYVSLPGVNAESVAYARATAAALAAAADEIEAALASAPIEEAVSL